MLADDIRQPADLFGGRRARRGRQAREGRAVAASGLVFLQRRAIGRHRRRLERLAEREVQVHGAGRRAGGLRDRAIRQRPQAAHQHGRRILLRRRDVHRPEHVVAVQLHLIDRLVGAAVAQLVAPVRREHQQRHLALVRLDHGRIEVGRCRARRAHDRGRPPRREPEPQREERGAALVQVRRDSHLGPCRERQRQRRRTRSGCDAHVAHARADQFIDEHVSPKDVAVHGIGVRRQQGRPLWPPSRFHRASTVELPGSPSQRHLQRATQPSSFVIRPSSSQPRSALHAPRSTTPSAPSARSIGRNLSAVSRHSFSGCESPTMPAPA